ncbi:hypothetical protein ACFQX6_08235 [Streptosporangium lutulentum]
MVLDEPTNHLDLRHQLDTLQLVRRLGVTAVVALHDLNLAAAFCDRICVLDTGRLVAAGPPAQVLTASLLAEVYRVDAEVDRHPVPESRRSAWCRTAWPTRAAVRRRTG